MADAQVRLFGARRPTDGAAILSACGSYRYLLTRQVADDPRCLVAIGLNPSTADAVVVDPTTTRLANRVRALGFGRLALVNLYALRGRDPRILDTHPDPVGPEWVHHLAALLDAVEPRDVVLACWGASGPRSSPQPARVLAMLASRGIQPRCLGLCRTGEPRHPLYVRADAALLPWTP